MSLLNKSVRDRAPRSVSVSLWASGLLLSVLTVGSTLADSSGSLRLARNDSGSILQAIAIEDWHFDAITGELTVTSAGGGRRCGISSSRKTDQTLILDGSRYPIESFRISDKAGKSVSVSPVIAGGLFPLCTVPSTQSLVSTGVAKGTTTGLNVEIDVLGRPPVDLGISDGIGYNIFTSPATISFGLDEDVMCLTDASQTGIRLSVTDSNQVVTSYSGFQSLDYRPFGGSGTVRPTLRARTDGNPICLALPQLAEVVTTETAAGVCSPADVFFQDGFETLGGGGMTAASTDLEIDLRLVANPNTTTNQNAVYELVVTNCGDNIATNVAVKDFYPTGASSGKATRLGSGSWTCTSGATCSGSGYVDVNLGDLNPGAMVVISVDRPLQAGTAGDNLVISASVAGLGDDGETDPVDNIASWQFDVRDNNAPVITQAGSCTIDEDAGSVDIAASGCNGGEGFQISGTDADGSIASASAVSLTPSLLTVSGSPIISGAGTASVTVTGLSITPVADANGTGTVQLSLIDDLGSPGTVDLSITVDPVNDAPTITVLGGFDFNDGAPLFSGPNCDINSSTGCADQIYPSDTQAEFEAFFDNWVVEVTPGPDDEASQTTSVSISLADPADASLFFGSSGRPDLRENPSVGTWDLDYVLSGNSGTAEVLITVTEDQDPTSETIFSFNVIVDNSVPVVSVTGSPDSLAEESVAQQLTGAGFSIVVTDAEADPVTLLVTSSDQTLVADADILVDDSDLNNVTVSVTTQPDAFGMVDLTVVASDGTPSAEATIALVVDNINDAPEVVFASQGAIEVDDNVISFAPGGSPTLTLDVNLTGIEDVPNFLRISGDVVLGPFEGGIQSLDSVTVDLTSDPDNIFAVDPEIDLAGVFEFVLTGSAGTATLEVSVTDDGGGDDTSGVTVLTVTAASP